MKIWPPGEKGTAVEIGLTPFSMLRVSCLLWLFLHLLSGELNMPFRILVTCLILDWDLPEAGPEMKIWMQVTYERGPPGSTNRKQGRETGKQAPRKCFHGWVPAFAVRAQHCRTSQRHCRLDFRCRVVPPGAKEPRDTGHLSPPLIGWEMLPQAFSPGSFWPSLCVGQARSPRRENPPGERQSRDGKLLAGAGSVLRCSARAASAVPSFRICKHGWHGCLLWSPSTKTYLGHISE